MIGTVSEMGESKSHKPKFKIDGRWYSAGKCPVNGLGVGLKIEFEPSEYQYDGKTYYGLESWRPVPQGPSPGDDARTAPRAPVAALEGLSEAELRFISNVVGSAITSGACKAPSDIGQWFRSAKAAVKAFDEDVP